MLFLKFWEWIEKIDPNCSPTNDGVLTSLPTIPKHYPGYLLYGGGKIY